jgi:hypothetical protein
LHVDIYGSCSLTNNTELLTVTNNASTGFSTFSDSLYTTMLLMFLVMAPNDVSFTNSVSPGIASIIYLSLVVFIGIICLNLLIALMSQRVAELDILKDDILLLQRISIVFFFEERIRSPVMRCCIRCWCCWRSCRRSKTKCRIGDGGSSDDIEHQDREEPKQVLLQCRESFLCDDGD